MAFSNARITVLQDGIPLRNATVVVGESQSRTNAEGVASFTTVPDGRQAIVILHENNKYVVQTSIQSAELSITVSSTEAPVGTPQQIAPSNVNLLDIGEQSVAVLGITLIILITVGGVVFFLFFKKNIDAYQRQLKQLGLLAMLGAVAGVSALIYSQTNMLTGKTQAGRFTTSTKAEVKGDIPTPGNVQVDVKENRIDVSWEQGTSTTPVVINGYHLEWMQEGTENTSEKRNIVVKTTKATLLDVKKGVNYVGTISAIDVTGNFSEPVEFTFTIPEN